MMRGGRLHLSRPWCPVGQHFPVTTVSVPPVCRKHACACEWRDVPLDVEAVVKAKDGITEIRRGRKVVHEKKGKAR